MDSSLEALYAPCMLLVSFGLARRPRESRMSQNSELYPFALVFINFDRIQGLDGPGCQAACGILWRPVTSCGILWRPAVAPITENSRIRGPPIQDSMDSWIHAVLEAAGWTLEALLVVWRDGMG